MSPGLLARPASTAPISAADTETCSCHLRNACSPCGLAGIDRQHHHMLMFSRRSLVAGETLYRMGEVFDRVHAVRIGTLKSSAALAGGRTQVCGFHLPGEVVGLDGVADGHHQTTATALEDTQTCTVAYRPLMELSVRLPRVQQDLHRLMSREASKAQWHLLMLGSMSAPERLAALLLDLSRRAAARGYSPSEFNLRMTRSDIGSYLGLSTATVCRVLKSFKDANVLEVDTRHIRFRDLQAFARTYSATVN